MTEPRQTRAGRMTPLTGLDLLRLLRYVNREHLYPDETAAARARFDEHADELRTRAENGESLANDCVRYFDEGIDPYGRP